MIRIPKNNIFVVIAVLSTAFTTGKSVSSDDHLNKNLASSRWLAVASTFSSNLPIVVINTNGKRIPDEPRLIAQMGIIDNGPEKRNTPNDPFNHYQGRITIELRGNTSLDFPKKAYAFETQKADGENDNVPLLGMPKENDWILYAPYSDKSLLRNVLTFKLARDMGRYAPRTRFCELILNDDYQGVYVLMEKIKRDKNRVDIARLTPTDTSGDDITGGYILKLDWEDHKSQGWHSPIDGTLFHFHHPQKKDLVPLQRRYIQNFISEFEAILAKDDYLDPVEGYRRFIDTGSFIDYFISAEVAHNADSYRISTYMYKDRDDRDGRLNMGPQWDYNLAYGNQDEGPFGTPYKWSWQVGLDDINFWWNRFLADPLFLEQLQQRWAELRTDILREERILTHIDSLAVALDEAQLRNFKRWPVLGEYVWPNAYIGKTYQDEINYLKDFLEKRLDWIDQNISKIDVKSEAEEPDDQENDQIRIPEKYKLNAFPNPFRQTIQFQYTLPVTRFVKLDIYNVIGQKMNTFIDAYQKAGDHNFDWNGANEQGDVVASGIYFGVLMINWEIRAVKKIIRY